MHFSNPVASCFLYKAKDLSVLLHLIFTGYIVEYLDLLLLLLLP
jgi:hypothetical protein